MRDDHFKIGGLRIEIDGYVFSTVEGRNDLLANLLKVSVVYKGYGAHLAFRSECLTTADIAAFRQNLNSLREKKRKTARLTTVEPSLRLRIDRFSGHRQVETDYLATVEIEPPEGFVTLCRLALPLDEDEVDGLMQEIDVILRRYPIRRSI